MISPICFNNFPFPFDQLIWKETQVHMKDENWTIQFFHVMIIVLFDDYVLKSVKTVPTAHCEFINQPLPCITILCWIDFIQVLLKAHTENTHTHTHTFSIFQLWSPYFYRLGMGSLESSSGLGIRECLYAYNRFQETSKYSQVLWRRWRRHILKYDLSTSHSNLRCL